MRIFFFHNPKTLLTFLVWSCQDIKKLCASLAGQCCWQGEGMGRDSSFTEPCSARWQQEGRKDGVRLLSCGLHPYQRGQGEPCGYIPLPAPTVENSIPPVLTAGFSPWFCCAGRITPMLEIQHSQGGKLHHFPVKKDGEGNCPSFSWVEPYHTLAQAWGGGWALLSWGFPCYCKSDTAARPEALLDASCCFWNFLSAFSEGSTAQGKEGCVGLQVPGKARLIFPVRPQANTLSRACVWTIHPSTSAVPGDRQASPTSHSFLHAFSSEFHISGSPKNHLFPLLGKTQKMCAAQCESHADGADEGHIQDQYTYTYRMKSLRVLSQWLSKDALWLSPAHSCSTSLLTDSNQT